jgi:di/tricarboxylate transporter
MIPQVLHWAQRTQESVARYLIPLSFAVVLGGVITTIGTSTNLVVSGLLQKSGGAPLGLCRDHASGRGVPLTITTIITTVLVIAWAWGL